MKVEIEIKLASEPPKHTKPVRGLIRITCDTKDGGKVGDLSFLLVYFSGTWIKPPECEVLAWAECDAITAATIWRAITPILQHSSTPC